MNVSKRKGCSYFIQIFICGYKCGYNYHDYKINYIEISLLNELFESGLRTIRTSKTIRESPSNPLKSTLAAIFTS